MSTTIPEQRRPMRASDQDRHEAILALSDQFVAGRLDHDEFERRMAAATQATYLHELDPLFADLPVRSPAGPQTSGPSQVRRRDRGHVPLAVVALVFVATVVLTHGLALWVLFPLWWVLAGGARRRAWHQHPMARGVTGRRW
jgi:hypothetical protein